MRPLLQSSSRRPVIIRLYERWQRKLNLECSAPHEKEKFREFLNGMNTHDRLRHRLWPLATLLSTRTVGDYESMPLPRAFWGIYYLTRPFRLASKVAGKIVRKISQDPLRSSAQHQ
jgi:hypothetical protein